MFDFVNTTNKEILSINILIKYQIDEISKSELMISNLEKCLDKQNETLIKFIAEKQSLESERGIIVNFNNSSNINSNNDKYQTLVDVTIKDVSKGSVNNDKIYERDHSDIFLNDHERDDEIMTLKCIISMYTAARNFYERIYKLSSKLDKPYWYDLTEIPNSIKTVEDDRCMVIVRNNGIKLMSLDKLFGKKVDCEWYIHVAMNNVIVSYHKDGHYGQEELRKQNTYHFKEWQSNEYEFRIRFSGSTAVAIEFIIPSPEDATAIDDEIETFEWTLPAAIFSKNISFLRRSMSIEEVRKRIVFLDTQCGIGDEGQAVMLLLAMVDYGGQVLENQYVCPRHHVKNFVDILNQETLCKEDEKKVLRRVEKKLRGKIIVGWDLAVANEVLGLRLDRIAGVRQLQGSRPVAIAMGGRDDSRMLLVVEQLKIEKLNMGNKAMNNVATIMAIYKHVEVYWSDDSIEVVEACRQLPVPVARQTRPWLFVSHENRMALMRQRALEEVTKKKEEGTDIMKSMFVSSPIS